MSDFFSRVRERIIKQGAVETGHVVEVLPPSGERLALVMSFAFLTPPSDAQSKGERWFMQVVDGTIKNHGSSGAKIASCRVRPSHAPSFPFIFVC